jgi:mevalonate kinase
MWRARVLFKACTVSAPGSLMLMGEHAVLHGFGALSMAVDKRIRVFLEPLAGNVVSIRSALGEYQGTLDTLVVENPFEFILSSILEHRAKIKSGFELRVESEFSAEVGLGSSAAVTLATLGALAKAFDFEIDLFEAGRHIVRKVQGGIGSGADLAASLLGGVVDFRTFQKIEVVAPIVVVYSGSKKPTTEVVAWVEEKRKKYPELYQAIFKAMDACGTQARLYLSTHNWHGLGNMMNVAQGLMSAMGLANAPIQRVLEALKQEPHIYGAKISGSGLGDCVIALGHLSANKSIQPLDCSPSLLGLCYE